MFLQNHWYCSALSSDLTSKPFPRTICGEPIVFFRSKKTGAPIALEDRCPHRQAPLSMGEVHGDEIMCAYHGLIFDRSGNCTYVPHQEMIPRKLCVKSYAVTEKWGFIWTWIGASESADISLVPNLRWVEDSDRATVYFYNHVKADYRLMADNLLDVSHADYLHSTSIGAHAGRRGQQGEVQLETEVRVEGTVVHYLRRLRNVEVGPVAKSWGDFQGKVVRTHIQKWEPPSVDYIQMEIEDETTKIVVNHDHIMTPETSNTCHYFFDWTRDFGIHGGYPTNEDVRRDIGTVIRTEDIPMVEAQQRVISRYAERPSDIPVKSDAFITQVHRVLKQLHEQNAKVASIAAE